VVRVAPPMACSSSAGEPPFPSTSELPSPSGGQLPARPRPIPAGEPSPRPSLAPRRWPVPPRPSLRRLTVLRRPSASFVRCSCYAAPSASRADREKKIRLWGTAHRRRGGPPYGCVKTLVWRRDEEDGHFSMPWCEYPNTNRYSLVSSIPSSKFINIQIIALVL
jgi:hypothetical protein